MDFTGTVTGIVRAAGRLQLPEYRGGGRQRVSVWLLCTRRVSDRKFKWGFVWNDSWKTIKAGFCGSFLQSYRRVPRLSLFHDLPGRLQAAPGAAGKQTGRKLLLPVLSDVFWCMPAETAGDRGSDPLAGACVSDTPFADCYSSHAPFAKARLRRSPLLRSSFLLIKWRSLRAFL